MQVYILNQGEIFHPWEANGKMTVDEHGSDWIAVEAENIEVVVKIGTAYDNCQNYGNNSTLRRLYRKRNTWLEMRQKHSDKDLSISEYCDIPNVVLKASALALKNL